MHHNIIIISSIHVTILHYLRIWKNLEGSGRIWKDLEESGRIWKNLEVSGRIWKDLEAKIFKITIWTQYKENRMCYLWMPNLNMIWSMRELKNRIGPFIPAILYTITDSIQFDSSMYSNQKELNLMKFWI